MSLIYEISNFRDKRYCNRKNNDRRDFGEIWKDEKIKME